MTTLTTQSTALPQRAQTEWTRYTRRFARNLPAVAGLVIFALIVLAAVFAPQVAPHDPLEQDYRSILAPPSAEHPFGTDDLGRDIFSRAIWGARESLRVGVLASAIAISGGLIFGILSGYVGGWVDSLIQRLVEVLLAFPTILLVLSIVAALGPSLTPVLIAAGISSIPVYVRMVRSTVLIAREKDYVLASRALGATDFRIMLHHILPNIVSTAIVYVTIGLGGTILATSGLSYVGLGAQPPTPEWGAMLTEGQRLFRSAWWPAVYPGLCIFVTVASINLLGDGLRAALHSDTSKL